MNYILYFVNYFLKKWYSTVRYKIIMIACLNGFNDAKVTTYDLSVEEIWDKYNQPLDIYYEELGSVYKFSVNCRPHKDEKYVFNTLDITCDNDFEYDFYDDVCVQTNSIHAHEK